MYASACPRMCCQVAVSIREPKRRASARQRSAICRCLALRVRVVQHGEEPQRVWALGRGACQLSISRARHGGAMSTVAERSRPANSRSLTSPTRSSRGSCASVPEPTSLPGLSELQTTAVS